MFNHDHINGSAEGGRVDRVPGLGDRATQAANVLHPDAGASAGNGLLFVYKILMGAICESDAGGEIESANGASSDYDSAEK